MDALKLAKICERLASDQDGEVLSAARIASSLLKDNGLTWTDVVNGGRRPKAKKADTGAENQPRVNVNWKTGPGRLARALIHEIMLVKKLSQQGLFDKLQYLWPTFQAYFEHPIKPNMVYGRYSNGVRPGSENEHPDKNPETRKYLPYAKAIVAANVPITDADVERILAEVAQPADTYSSTIAINTTRLR